MSKTIAVIVAIAMVAHLIRPFGLPGLTRRADAWKLAFAAFAVIILVAMVRPEG